MEWVLPTCAIASVGMARHLSLCALREVTRAKFLCVPKSSALIENTAQETDRVRDGQMEGAYLENQGKLPGGGRFIFLAYELNQNRTTQTGFLIHSVKSVGLKGWPTTWDWKPVSPGQEDALLWTVGAHAPIHSSGNPAGAVTPQHLPRASQLRLDPDVYLFSPGFPFVCSVGVRGRP